MKTEEKVIQRVIDLVEDNIEKATTMWSGKNEIQPSFVLKLEGLRIHGMRHGALLEPINDDINSEDMKHYREKIQDLYNQIKEKDMEKLLNELNEVK